MLLRPERNPFDHRLLNAEPLWLPLDAILSLELDDEFSEVVGG